MSIERARSWLGSVTLLAALAASVPVAGIAAEIDFPADEWSRAETPASEWDIGKLEVAIPEGEEDSTSGRLNVGKAGARRD